MDQDRDVYCLYGPQLAHLWRCERIVISDRVDVSSILWHFVRSGTNAKLSTVPLLSDDVIPALRMSSACGTLFTHWYYFFGCMYIVHKHWSCTLTWAFLVKLHAPCLLNPFSFFCGQEIVRASLSDISLDFRGSSRTTSVQSPNRPQVDTGRSQTFTDNRKWDWKILITTFSFKFNGSSFFNGAFTFQI